jgi:hypothetical protein
MILGRDSGIDALWSFFIEALISPVDEFIKIID